MTKHRQTNGPRFAAPPLDLNGRPPQHVALQERLIAEGWLYDMSVIDGTPIHEWVLGEPHPVAGGVGWDAEERGRIAWSTFPADEPVLASAVAVQVDGCWAWLRHPKTQRFA